MTLYIDLYFLLNFAMDTLILLICRRVLGYHRRTGRILLAAALGALYSLAALYIPAPFSVFLHLFFGALMLAISLGYGNLRRFLRLCMLFYGVSFLLGGAVSALIRGIDRIRNGHNAQIGIVLVLVCAIVGAFVCLVWGGVQSRRKISVTVQLRTNRGALSFDCYVDTGNRLREPLENTAVLLANAALSAKVYALFSEKPLPAAPPFAPEAFTGLPLRLIPLKTVTGKAVLPALKCENAVLDGVKMPLCVALDLGRKGDYCGFEALASDQFL